MSKDLTQIAEQFELPEDDPLRDMMTEDGSPWTIDERLRAVMLFQVTGSSKKVNKLTGIPASTIRYWKNTKEWWSEAARQARKQHQEQLDAMMSGVIHRSIQEIGERVENGNVKVLKDGTQVQVPMHSDELVRTVDKIYDKRALGRGDPTSRQERVDTNEMLSSLFKQFESMVEKHHKPTSMIDMESAEDAEFTEEPINHAESISESPSEQKESTEESPEESNV